MNQESRRSFLRDVGCGMLAASVGPAVVGQLGLSTAFAADEADSLQFGRLESLVALMQETPVNRLQPLLVQRLRDRTSTLHDLISAGALANARTFGGQDYVGFHVAMALVPSLEMSFELPEQRRPLPILKVLYRNTAQIQNNGGRRNEVLRPVQPANLTGDNQDMQLREAVYGNQTQRAEQIFAGICRRPADQAYNMLQQTVQEYSNVHRVVLAHRAWELVGVLGRDHAHTLLRQCVRYCLQEDAASRRRGNNRRLPDIVSRQIEQHRLMARPPGTRDPGDRWVAEFCNTIYRSTGEQAVNAVAAALGEGISPNVVGEALSLAANQLILRHEREGDRAHLVHGARSGVHSADAMNAWRNIARQCDYRTGVAALMSGAYDVAKNNLFRQDPYPHADHVRQVRGQNGETLLAELEEAIRGNDQARAAAVAHRYGEMNLAPRPIFSLMLRYAVSEDGRLHAEKYYRTATEEFANTRRAFRWRHVVSLARVSASAFGLNHDDRPGHRAPGYEEACRLLEVTA